MPQRQRIFVLFCVCAALLVAVTGCDSIGGPDPRLSIESDVTGYFLTRPYSKSDLLPPRPATPVINVPFSTPAPQPPAATPAPATKPAAKPIVNKTAYSMPAAFMPPTCNGPNCTDCRQGCGANCPNGQCQIVTVLPKTAWQSSGQYVQSPQPPTIITQLSQRRRAGWF